MGIPHILGFAQHVFNRTQSNVQVCLNRDAADDHMTRKHQRQGCTPGTDLGFGGGEGGSEGPGGELQATAPIDSM
jgi:hypothetical protein